LVVVAVARLLQWLDPTAFPSLSITKIDFFFVKLARMISIASTCRSWDRRSAMRMLPLTIIAEFSLDCFRVKSRIRLSRMFRQAKLVGAKLFWANSISFLEGSPCANRIREPHSMLLRGANMMDADRLESFGRTSAVCLIDGAGRRGWKSDDRPSVVQDVLFASVPPEGLATLKRQKDQASLSILVWPRSRETAFPGCTFSTCCQAKAKRRGTPPWNPTR